MDLRSGQEIKTVFFLPVGIGTRTDKGEIDRPLSEKHIQLAIGLPLNELDLQTELIPNIVQETIVI